MITEYTEKELNARGYKAEPAETAYEEASCNGCVFNQPQHLGIKCAQVPCSWFTMGRDVIWLHKDRK